MFTSKPQGQVCCELAVLKWAHVAADLTLGCHPRTRSPSSYLAPQYLQQASVTRHARAWLIYPGAGSVCYTSHDSLVQYNGTLHVDETAMIMSHYIDILPHCPTLHAR